MRNYLGLLAAGLMSSTAVYAADTEKKTEGLEEIVVTAQKGARAESIQKIPVAITAYSSEKLAQSQITSVTEIARLTPGARLENSTVAGFPNFYIRGLGISGSVRSVDPTVSVNVDGMPQEYAVGTVLDVDDAERVEVLRGPQGILFGRNATGGAISLITKRPTNEWHGQLKVRGGNLGRFDTYGLISGPIVKDKVLAKISVNRKSSDGFYEDKGAGTFVPAPLNPGGTDTSFAGRQRKEDVLSIAPTLEFRPTERLTITVIGNYNADRGGGAPSRLKFPVPNIQTYLGYTPPSQYDADQANWNGDGRHTLFTKRLVADVQYRLDAGTLTYISGYRDVSYRLRADIDGTPFTLFHYPPDGNKDKSTQLSHELRFASDFSDQFRFVAGAYYSNLKWSYQERRVMSPLIQTPNAAPTNPLIGLQGLSRQTGTTLAFFYNMDWNPIPQLRLSHGGRYTRDEKTFWVVPLTQCNIPFTECPFASTQKSGNWRDFSPRFGVEYQWTPGLLTYATYTRGYRSGNFNSRATALNQIGPANPESVEQIELGVKSTFWNNRARVNLAMYSSLYANIQRIVLVNLIQTLANAGSAKIKGVEMELAVEPIDKLVFTGSLGYTDARFTSFNGLSGVSPADAVRLKFDGLPAWTTFIQGQYTFQIPNFEPEFTARASYAWTSSSYADILNQIRDDAYGIVDAGLSMNYNSWTLSLYGKNLTDQYHPGLTYGVGLGPTANPFSNRFAVLQAGSSLREYGIELTYKF